MLSLMNGLAQLETRRRYAVVRFVPVETRSLNLKKKFPLDWEIHADETAAGDQAGFVDAVVIYTRRGPELLASMAKEVKVPIEVGALR